MQKKLTLIILILSLQGYSKQALASGVQSSAQGTDTGNVLSPAFFSTVLVSNICQRIHECHPAASTTKCEAQVAAIDGLPKKFGVPDSKKIRTMEELLKAELNLRISGDVLKHISCVSAILAMSCSNPSIKNAYDSKTDSFARTTNLILPTGDCQSVY